MSEWVSILHVTSVHVSALEGVKNFTNQTNGEANSRSRIDWIANDDEENADYADNDCR